MDFTRIAARVAGAEKRVSVSLTAEEAKKLVELVKGDPGIHGKVKEAVDAVPWRTDRVEGWVPPDQRKTAAIEDPTDDDMAEEILAQEPTPGNVSSFKSALDACPSNTAALEAMARALESNDDQVAASLVRGVRPDMADHESSSM